MRINKKVLKSMHPDRMGRATSMYLLGKNRHGVIVRAVQINSGYGHGCSTIPGANTKRMVEAKIAMESTGFTVYGIALVLNNALSVREMLANFAHSWDLFGYSQDMRLVWQFIYSLRCPLMFLKKGVLNDDEYVFAKEGKPYGKKYN